MHRVLAGSLLVLATCQVSCGRWEISRRGELNPGLDDVDWTDALGHVERAAIAYEPDEVIEARYPGCQIWTAVDDQVKAFIDVDELSGAQWLTIRGTANRANALEDIEYAKEDDPLLGIRLHAGFGAASLGVLDWALPRLDRERPLRLAGHSLGGAIAVIVEAQLVARGYGVERCVTIGQPKVTNEAGARKLDENPLLRIVNEDDPVPMVPPLTALSAAHGIYRHFGPEAVLLSQGGFRYLHQHDAERFAVTSAWRNLDHLSLKAHSSQLYLQRVRQLAEAQ